MKKYTVYHLFDTQKQQLIGKPVTQLDDTPRGMGIAMIDTIKCLITQTTKERQDIVGWELTSRASKGEPSVSVVSYINRYGLAEKKIGFEPNLTRWKDPYLYMSFDIVYTASDDEWEEHGEFVNQDQRYVVLEIGTVAAKTILGAVVQATATHWQVPTWDNTLAP